MRGATWRFVAFLAICALGAFAMVMVFGQLRFDRQDSYNAEFTNVSGLQGGNFVRIAGVEVGKVKKISIKADNTALVQFSAEPSVVLTEGSRAVIRWDNLIGGRYLELQDGPGAVTRLKPGQTIPINRTEPALDLDALIGGFRPLFRALDPEQVNALSGQLIDALQGQGAMIGSFLANTATLTNTLADRDKLIGEVIVNLNTVLGSLSGQSAQFAKTVDSLSALVKGLAERKSDIGRSVASTNEAAATLADLFAQAREPIKETVRQSDRVGSLVLADHEYFDDLLNTLPDAYQRLARQGLYGDFFSFYLCEVVLKLNGKGGQPVFVKVAGQSTGRCTPK